MAKYLKNTQLRGGSYAIQLPMGTSLRGPDSPVNGQIRFNQTTNKIEFYYNNLWNQIAKIGTVDIEIDNLTLSVSNAQYPMKYSYKSGEEAYVLVFVGGVQQTPLVNYQFEQSGLSSNLLYLQPGPGDDGQTLVVIHNLNSTKTIGD
jgi:hypothetical protein